MYLVNYQLKEDKFTFVKLKKKQFKKFNNYLNNNNKIKKKIIIFKNSLI